MIVKPRFRGFICTTAHPAGCAAHVRDQIDYIRSLPKIDGPKRVLVVGSSTGYGLASRIAYAFGSETIGIFFEKPGTPTRTGTAGFYNNRAFEEAAREAGLPAYSINGDAFSHDVKRQAIELIHRRFEGGQVDMVIYSLASPRRKDPDSDAVYASVIQPIGEEYHSRTVDFHTGEVRDVSIPAAAPEEIESTVKVMGGEDWELWIQALKDADALAPGVQTLAYSYIGPSLTHAVYKDGTIGRAKEDLERAARAIETALSSLGGHAWVSVNKAVVTQSSSAIPVVPLYMALLFDIMAQKGLQEDCIQQMRRMSETLLESPVPVDAENRLRLDDWEMRPDVQAEVLRRWEGITTENLPERGDLDAFRRGFFALFGFGREDIAYDAEVETE